MTSTTGGETDDAARRPSTAAACKNCGAALSGAYCSACGQAADVHVPSLAEVVVEVLGDLYNFDSRLWRSVAALLVAPGRLTQRYLEGRRARYVPPFKLYVVSSVIFFLLVSLGGGDDGALDPDLDSDQVAAAAPQPGLPLQELDASIRSAVEEAALPASSRGAPSAIDIELDREDGTDGWSCELDEPLSSEWRARWERACERIRADSGASFARALTDNIALMMLMFIPIVAANMKLLYPLSGRKYVEHLVFFLHFHTFFFFLATLAMLLSRLRGVVPTLGSPTLVLEFAAWLYLPVYLFMAMRHVYGQSRLATAAKLMLLGGGYTIGLLATLLAVVFYTALAL